MGLFSGAWVTGAKSSTANCPPPALTRSKTQYPLLFKKTGEGLRKCLRPLLKFQRHMAPRIVHTKPKRQFAVEIPAKKGQIMNVWRRRTLRPAAQYYCGNEGEDAPEGSAFLANGGPAKVHPRKHQLRRRQTRDIHLPSERLHVQCTR